LVIGLLDQRRRLLLGEDTLLHEQVDQINRRIGRRRRVARYDRSLGRWIGGLLSCCRQNRSEAAEHRGDWRQRALRLLVENHNATPPTQRVLTNSSSCDRTPGA